MLKVNLILIQNHLQVAPQSGFSITRDRRMGGHPHKSKKTKYPFIRVLPTKCLFLLHKSQPPPPPPPPPPLPQACIFKTIHYHESPLQVAWKLFSAFPLTEILKIFLLNRHVWKNLTVFHNFQVDQINSGNSLELLRVV